MGEARDKRDKARAILRDGRDPSLEKRLAAAAGAIDAANLFEAVAVSWHDLHKAKWSISHANDVIDSLSRDVFPSLGALPINQITPAMVLETLRAVEQRPAIETARRYGWGVPDLTHALLSASNDATLMVEDALLPFRKDGSAIKTRDMHLHRLPWPRDELLARSQSPAHISQAG